MEKHCEWCGEPFIARAYELNRGYARTCSKTCGAYLREQIKRGDGAVFPTDDTINWDKFNDLDIEDYE